MAVMFIYTSWCSVPCPLLMAIASAQGRIGEGICREQKSSQPAGGGFGCATAAQCVGGTLLQTCPATSPLHLSPSHPSLLFFQMDARLTAGLLSPAGTCAESLL